MIASKTVWRNMINRSTPLVYTGSITAAKGEGHIRAVTKQVREDGNYCALFINKRTGKENWGGQRISP